MDLLDCPFHLLGASTRDPQARLQFLAEERGLFGDPAQFERLQAELTHPRKRLLAELAWVPGAEPAQAESLASEVQQGRGPPVSSTLSPLAEANRLATLLKRWPLETERSLLEGRILLLARAFSSVRSSEVLALINRDRKIAGLVEAGADWVDEGLRERRQFFCAVVKEQLDRLPTVELVASLTRMVIHASLDGTKSAPIVVDDLIEAYETAAHQFLAAETANLDRIGKALVAAVEAKKERSAIDRLLVRMGSVAENWLEVALPIQVSFQARGKQHTATHQAWGVVRSAALELTNKHDLIVDSRRLTGVQASLGARDFELSERSARDQKQLDEMAAKAAKIREQEQKKEAERRKSLEYQAVFGLVFKDPFRFSADGIEWQSRRWPLESITRIRWGIIRRSTNGIPTGTDYLVNFGTRELETRVSAPGEDAFRNITDRLWRGVGVRILTEWMQQLAAGARIPVGRLRIADEGIDMLRSRFFKADELVFVPWSEVVIATRNGAFIVQKKGDASVLESLDYVSVDNAHVLEAALRMFFKTSELRLSSLLR